MAGATHAGHRRPSNLVLLHAARGGAQALLLTMLVLQFLRFPGRDRRLARLIRRSLHVYAVARNGRGCWQARKDLNPRQAGWSRVCCRYTTGLWWLREKESNLQTPVPETSVSTDRNYPALLVGVAGFEPAISPARGADVGQATPHAEKANAAAPDRHLALGSSGVTLDRHSPLRSGTGAFQARQSRANDAERHRFQIMPVLCL